MKDGIKLRNKSQEMTENASLWRWLQTPGFLSASKLAELVSFHFLIESTEGNLVFWPVHQSSQRAAESRLPGSCSHFEADVGSNCENRAEEESQALPGCCRVSGLWSCFWEGVNGKTECIFRQFLFFTPSNPALQIPAQH